MNGVQIAINNAIGFLPTRFHEEFLEILSMCSQNTYSVNKNLDYFLENILDELTENEKRIMFVEIK